MYMVEDDTGTWLAGPYADVDVAVSMARVIIDEGYENVRVVDDENVVVFNSQD